MEKKEIQFKQRTWITVAVTQASKVCEAAERTWNRTPNWFNELPEVCPSEFPFKMISKLTMSF